MTDLLAPLLGLPGVADAAESARDALARAHRHRTNLRNWPVTAAESAIRGARSSSALDGGAVQLDAAGVGPNDPVLAGALRVGQALEGGATTLVGVWQRAPLQALARLHALAAADLVDERLLGRPRQDPEVSPRRSAQPPRRRAATRTGRHRSAEFRPAPAHRRRRGDTNTVVDRVLGSDTRARGPPRGRVRLRSAPDRAPR